MATSGTLNSSNYQGRYIQFKWTASQSVSDNKSKISWTLKGAGTGEYTWYKAGAFKVVIDGSTVYSTGENDRITLYDGTEIASGTKTLTHKTDGSRTFKVSIEAGIYTYAVNCTGSTTFTLDTIPRASTFTVSSTSANMDTEVTFNITRASSAFTHKLTYSFDGKTGTIGTDIATSKSWTIPLSLAAAIPSKTSGTATITLTTYNGSTAIGTKTLTMTLKVPSSVVPTISSVTITEATSGLADKFGAFIQNKSKLKVVISASGVQSSTIKSYSTKILSKTYKGSTITSGLITSSGSVRVAVTVKDSRGRTATTTENVTVLVYTDPKITSFTAQRCDSDGTLNDDGEYVQLAYSFEITSLNSKNNNAYSIAYKLPSDSSYTSLTSGNAYSANTTYVPATLFNVDNSYEIKLTVKDYFKTVTYIVELSTAFTIVDYHSSGKGMAIGKVSEEQDIFDINLETLFRKNLVLAYDQSIYGVDTDGNKRNVLKPVSPDGNTVIGYTNYVNADANTHIYGNNIIFFVAAADNVNYKPYFCKGDSIVVNYTGAGFITTSKTNVCFTLPLIKPIIGSPSISVSADTGFVLRQDANYTHGSVADGHVVPSSYRFAVTVSGIRVIATFDDTTNAVNNAPIGIEWKATLTLS